MKSNKVLPFRKGQLLTFEDLVARATELHATKPIDTCLILGQSEDGEVFFRVTANVSVGELCYLKEWLTEKIRQQLMSP